MSGRYFDGLKDMRSSAESYDVDAAGDLWSTSERLCGLSGQAGRHTSPASTRS